MQNYKFSEAFQCWVKVEVSYRGIWDLLHSRRHRMNEQGKVHEISDRPWQRHATTTNTISDQKAVYRRLISTSTRHSLSIKKRRATDEDEINNKNNTHHVNTIKSSKFTPNVFYLDFLFRTKKLNQVFKVNWDFPGWYWSIVITCIKCFVTVQLVHVVIGWCPIVGIGI